LTLRATHVQTQAVDYSRPGGAWDVPTLDALMARCAWVSEGKTRLAPGEIEDRVAHLAGWLRAHGVRHGDAVAWQLPNGLDAFLLYRACWRLGAVGVPFHHQAGGAEVARMRDQVDSRLVFARSDGLLAEATGVVLIPPVGLARSHEHHGPAVTDSGARGDDLAVALFTSGSTGDPKVVLHTHRALAHKGLSSIRAHGLGPGDAVLMPSPLAHVSGLLNGVVVPGAGGMGCVLMDRWDPGRGLELVERYDISFMIGPPALFTAMIGHERFRPERVASLRVISCGSMGITPEFVESARAAFGAFTKRTYGSTEAPTVTTSAWSDPPERARDTDGRPMALAELRAVDPGGADVPAGQPGELLVRGPEMFAGYADAAQTAAAMEDGWFRTGDLAILDPDGWLTIVGRSKELIIRGGENIAPQEVERILEAHPAVRQAVAVGYPDERLGERVAAFVIASSPFDMEDCQGWFAKQGVARFKTPERVYLVDELPTLSLGKPDRAALRARCRDEAVR
jgi:cyclohexanecarboxylate-CoA ligase